MLSFSHVLLLVFLPTYLACPFIPSFLYSSYLSKFLYLHFYIFLFCIPHLPFYFHLVTESFIFSLPYLPSFLYTFFFFAYSLPSLHQLSACLLAILPLPNFLFILVYIYFSFSHFLLSLPTSITLQSSSTILSCVLSFLCFYLTSLLQFFFSHQSSSFSLCDVL